MGSSDCDFQEAFPTSLRSDSSSCFSYRSEKGSSSYADHSASRLSDAGPSPRVSLAAPELPVVVYCGQFGCQCSQSRITECGCPICDRSTRLYTPLHQ